MEIRAVKFRVGQGWRVGGLYNPTRSSPSPAVLMLHGFPGVQQNEDIAAELCRLGATVLMPHFRGSWGSEGRYSLPGLFHDARAALHLLRRYHHVDPERIGILGYSFGGWVALRLASEGGVAAVACMAPGMPRDDHPEDHGYLLRNAKVLNLPQPAMIWRQYLAAAEVDHPDAYVRRIAPAPVLFIQGLEDRVVPPDSTRRLYALAKEPKDLLEFPDEDHDFQADRANVVAAVAGWLSLRLTPAAVHAA